MAGYIKRIRKAIWHRVDPSDKGKVWRIMRHPPEVRDDEIVFTSSDDFTGNPKALFLYMIDHGYNERYKITWLFERKENCFDFGIPNVSSAVIWNDKGGRTPAAQKAAMRAKYIFYSHNVHWVRNFRPEQNFVDLWHGCGYKDEMKSDERTIYYDYLIVTGSKYIDIFRRVLRDPDGKVLDLGYPRNEFLFSERSQARKLLADLKEKRGADKAVIWMPTYRKSVFARLDSDTAKGATGLPVVYEESDLAELDAFCRREGMLLVLKQHFLQQNYAASDKGLTNILFIDEKYLRDNDADLYELMGATDALLTDYSSVAIDYMLLDKPIGYTLDDFDEYDHARGFSFEGVRDYMPGHHIYTMEDLKGFIKDVAAGLDPYKEHRSEVRPQMQTYTDGFSKRILDYFGI